MKCKTLDKIDRDIMSLLHDTPSLTHTEIADRLGRSQPAIGARIRKLKENGFLTFQVGTVIIPEKQFVVAKIDIKTSDPHDIKEFASYCPFIIGSFKLSGSYNLNLLIIARSIRELDIIIDHHLRFRSNISELKVNLVTELNPPMAFPINWRIIEIGKEHQCTCSQCKRIWDLKKSKDKTTQSLETAPIELLQ